MFTDHRWKIEAHNSSNGCDIMFHPILNFNFITSSSLNGEIKIWKLEKNGPSLLHTLSVSENNRRHLVNMCYSCDCSMLFGCSGSQVFAWECKNYSLLSSFELRGEIDQISYLLPHLEVPNLVLIICKLTISIWDPISNTINCKITSSDAEPLFQQCFWYKSNSIIVKINNGTFKIYSSDKQQWNQLQNIEVINQNKWPTDFMNKFSKYVEPQIIITLKEIEKAKIKTFQIQNIDIFSSENTSTTTSDSEYV